MVGMVGDCQICKISKRKVHKSRPSPFELRDCFPRHPLDKASVLWTLWTLEDLTAAAPSAPGTGKALKTLIEHRWDMTTWRHDDVTEIHSHSCSDCWFTLRNSIFVGRSRLWFESPGPHNSEVLPNLWPANLGNLCILGNEEPEHSDMSKRQNISKLFWMLVFQKIMLC